MMRLAIKVVGLLLAATVSALSVPAALADKDVPFVAGEAWLKSAAPLKRAYLIGIANLMSVEYAFQMETGPPPDNQTTIRRLFEEIDDVTLDETVDRIDQWYKKHPDKKDMTVLEVIWVDMVRPNLPASRSYE